LDASWEKLVNKYQPSKPLKAARSSTTVLTLQPASIRQTSVTGTSLNGGVDPKPAPSEKRTYTGEMLEREQAAQAQFERMKQRVAPPGNKMAAQYLSESECVAFRAGELRRR
jgi:hypothetical protein